MPVLAQPHNIVYFYRSGRLVKGRHALGYEIPLGFRFVFLANPFLLRAEIAHFRQWQNDCHNPFLLSSRIRRAQFFQRWLDPFLLPFARCILFVVKRWRIAILIVGRAAVKWGLVSHKQAEKEEIPYALHQACIVPQFHRAETRPNACNPNHQPLADSCSENRL